MKNILDTPNETKVFEDLLPYYLSNTSISASDKDALLRYSAVSYDLLGLIGLLTQNMPRILLGKVCYNTFIKEKCNEVDHNLKDLEAIADIYMEVEHTEADEFVFRSVMSKYPKDLVDENGQLLKRGS